KDWMARIPDWPAMRRCQTASTPLPSGVTRPKPVTTTRRIAPLLLERGSGGNCRAGNPARRFAAQSGIGLDERDRVLDGQDLLRRVIRNLAAELLLKGHNQLDRV